MNPEKFAFRRGHWKEKRNTEHETIHGKISTDPGFVRHL
jgi:hypothetical protein